MPLYMDRHEVPGVSAIEVAEGHVRDVEIQDRYGVQYLTYWHDPKAGTAFCLARGPSREAVDTVHREAHGLVASQIIEVEDAMVSAFLGRVIEPPIGEPFAETAFRTILFTDIVGSTSLTQRLGDAAAMALLRTHDRIVRDALGTHNGREVKHTGDGIMASFNLVGDAALGAVRIQRAVAEYNATADRSAAAQGRPGGGGAGHGGGGPVRRGGPARRSPVRAGRMPMTSSARARCATSASASGWRFVDRGEATLQGFDEAIRVYELVWADA